MTDTDETRTEPEPASAEPGDPGEKSPIGRLAETIGRLPRYLVLAAGLMRDPSIGRWRKAGLAASLAYAVSPIDFVPGIIPVAGQLDDLAALLLGIRTALRGASADARATHLEAAGLAPGTIERDLSNVRAAAGWLAGRVANVGARVGRASLSGAGKLLGLGARGAKALAAEAAKRVG